MLQHFFEKRNALTLLEGEAQLGALKATSDSHWAVIGDFEISYSVRGAKLHFFPLPSDVHLRGNAQHLCFQQYIFGSLPKRGIVAYVHIVAAHCLGHLLNIDIEQRFNKR